MPSERGIPAWTIGIKHIPSAFNSSNFCILPDHDPLYLAKVGVNTLTVNRKFVIHPTTMENQTQGEPTTQE